MKKIILVIGLSGIIYSCSWNRSTNENIPNTLIVASDTAGVRYQCPMKCQSDTTYTTQGACPVCGMDLELVQKN